MAVPLGELELSGTSVARDLCPSAFPLELRVSSGPALLWSALPSTLWFG